MYVFLNMRCIGSKCCFIVLYCIMKCYDVTVSSWVEMTSKTMFAVFDQLVNRTKIPLRKQITNFQSQHKLCF